MTEPAQRMTPRLILVIGSASGFLTVALGAFAAHGLKQQLSPEHLDIFRTGVDYQGLHTLALLFTGLFALQNNQPSPGLPGLAAWAFTLGICLFSGSLYLLAITGVRWLGMLTPLGGIAFLIGWACLAIATWKINK